MILREEFLDLDSYKKLPLSGCSETEIVIWKGKDLMENCI